MNTKLFTLYIALAFAFTILPTVVSATTSLDDNASVQYTLEAPSNTYIQQYVNTDIPLRQYSDPADVNQDGIQDIFFEEGIVFGNDDLAATYTTDDLDIRILENEEITGSGEHFYNTIRFIADINGDHYPDYILANGTIYFGSANRVGDIVTSLTPPDLVLTHTETDREQNNDLAKIEPMAVADVNGDGMQDLFIRVLVEDDESSHRYLGLFIIYGKSVFPSTIELSTDADGFAEYGNNATINVMKIGDMNNDGRDDVGVVLSQNGNRPKYMKTYFGRKHFAEKFIGTLPKAQLRIQIPAFNSTVDQGEIAAAGDVNGDGFDDLMVSNPAANRTSSKDAGKIYIFLGAKSFHKKNKNLVHANVILKGGTKKEYAGIDVASVGDINGDGSDDLIIGFGTTGLYAPTNRMAYIVLGDVSWKKNKHQKIVLTENSYPIISVAGEIFGTAIGDINNDNANEFILYSTNYYTADNEDGFTNSLILSYNNIVTN